MLHCIVKRHDTKVKQLHDFIVQVFLSSDSKQLDCSMQDYFLPQLYHMCYCVNKCRIIVLLACCRSSDKAW